MDNSKLFHNPSLHYFPKTNFYKIKAYYHLQMLFIEDHNHIPRLNYFPHTIHNLCVTSKHFTFYTLFRFPFEPCISCQAAPAASFLAHIKSVFVAAIQGRCRWIDATQQLHSFIEHLWGTAAGPVSFPSYRPGSLKTHHAVGL